MKTTDKRMPRIIHSTVALLAIAALLLSGCSAPAESGSSATAPAVTTAAADGATASPAQEATGAPTSTPEKVALSDSGKVGKFDVKILDATFGKNSEGKSIIVVNIEWTNNSDRASAFDVVLTVDASQNGTDLDSSVAPEGDTKSDLDAKSKAVQPGETQQVWVAFLMNDDSKVDTEVSEFLSIGGNKLAKTFDPAASK